MHKLFGVVFVSILAVLLLAGSVPAGPTGAPLAPLGVVMSADNARSGVDVIYSGATIYDGDRLLTQDGGAMKVRLGTGQLFLHQGTSVQMHAIANGFSAALDNGTVSVSSAEGQTFQLLADGASIRPASSHATAAQIQRVSATEVILISSRGDLQVAMGDEVETVSAGNSYKMELDPAAADPAANPQGPPTGGGKQRKGFFIVVIGAVAAITGVMIWRATESPTSPQ